MYCFNCQVISTSKQQVDLLRSFESDLCPGPHLGSPHQGALRKSEDLFKNGYLGEKSLFLQKVRAFSCKIILSPWPHLVLIYPHQAAYISQQFLQDLMHKPEIRCTVFIQFYLCLHLVGYLALTHIFVKGPRPKTAKGLLIFCFAKHNLFVRFLIIIFYMVSDYTL